MEQIIKLLSPSILTLVLPSILLKAGNYFKNKDSNNSGADDVTGNMLIALAPVMMALDDKNETAFKKGVRVVRDTINGYLGE